MDGWRATHRTESAGAHAWVAPDPTAAAAPPLDGQLEVMLLESRAPSWALVRCANGWTTWVDGRRLVPVSLPGAVAPAGPPPFPPPAPPPPARRKGRAWLALVGLVLLAVAVGAAVFLALPASDRDSGAKAVSAAMLTLSVGAFVMSLVGARRPQRSRRLADLVRAACSAAAVLALGLFTHASAPTPALLVVGGVALLVGLVEGAAGRLVRGSDGHRWAHRPRVPLVVTFAGVLVGLVATIGDRSQTVSVGQLIGIAGVGLALGVALTRAVRRGTPTNRTGAYAGGLATVLLALAIGGIGALGFATDLAQPTAAGAQASLDGTFEGKMDLPAASGTTLTVNRVALTLADGQLTGEILFGFTQQVVLDPKQGPVPMCGTLLITIAPGELTPTAQPDAVRFSGTTTVHSGSATGDVPCTGPAEEVDASPGLVTVTVTADQAVVEVADPSDPADVVGRGTIPRTGGGTTPPPPIGDPGVPQVPGTVADPTPPGTIPGSGRVPPPLEPATGVLGPKVPIDPEDAAATAIAVVIAMGTGGIISMKEAGDAKRALEGGAVPADVIARLGGGDAINKLGQNPALEALIQQREAWWREAAGTLSTFPSSRTLGVDPYVTYVQHVEARFPWATPQEVVAALHKDIYGHDMARNLPKTNIPIFEHGPETDRAEGILPFLSAGPANNAVGGHPVTNHTPKWVVDRSGNRVDIGHAYAGLRSDLNRPPGAFDTLVRAGGWQVQGPGERNFLRWANTHGGDSWQVIAETGPRSLDAKQLAIAWDMAPPDQRLGNDVGVWLSDFYRNPANGQVPLSRAMQTFFDHHTANAPPGRTSYY